MTDKRSSFWDLAKGVAIIAVILIHTTSYNSAGGVVWRQFINFPVAVFFFMAGYFCHVREPYGEFVAKKTKRLLVPLGAASLAYCAIELYFVWRGGQTLSPYRVLGAMFSFPTGWGYFVVALFQCMLLAPIIKKYTNSPWLLRVSFLTYFASALYFYLGNTVFVGKWMVSYSVPIIFCTAWLPLFSLGMRLQDRRISAWTPCARTWFVLSLLLTWAIIGGLFWHNNATIQLARSQLRLPCILFAFVLSAFLANLSDCWMPDSVVWRPLARLGESSFFVYLWHRLALISLRGFLPQFAEWHFVFAIVGFVILAALLPRSLAKRFWWLGL